MSVVRLSEYAREEGTYGVELTFTDEDGDALTPNALEWRLSTTDGTVVNSRSGVAILPTASTVTVVLSGDDLEILSTQDNRLRRLTIVGTFDSSLGSNLPLHAECEFNICDLVGIT